MIRGVAVVFGLVAIGLLLVGAVVVALKFTDWLDRRRQLRLVTRKPESKTPGGRVP